ncbi:MCE family protein [Sciscionella marina]|uniref:MCE family protein n=1 Tax=Sciscionella marina TaxID=508770 RepID=UPI000684E453|nr:MCE family protein [Sciscionella marina]
MRVAKCAVFLVAAIMVAGCSAGDGVWPGGEGDGDGSYTVNIEFENLNNVFSNAQVMDNNVVVGAVTGMRPDHWHALATVRLNRNVILPKNAVAKIGQTSLLGSSHIELGPPPGEAPVGRLADGGSIPLSRTKAYPDTEETLAGASNLLNGGGLQNLSTITSEVNNALGGRENVARDALHKINDLVSSADRQKSSIVHALDGLNELGKQGAAHTQTIKKTLSELPRALSVLDQERPQITDALNNIGKFSDQSDDVFRNLQRPLVDNLNHLKNVSRSLADSGDSLVKATNIIASGPFPVRMEDAPKETAVRGDFTNLYLTIDLSNEQLKRDELAFVSPQAIKGLVGGVGSEVGSLLTGPLQGLGGKKKQDTNPAPTPAPPSPGAGDQHKDGGGGLLGGLLGSLGGH